MEDNKQHFDKTKIKNWDSVTKWILGISVFIIVFSFLSPIIFTLESKFNSFDFTNTGQIGDTIGGIMNPFIALAGVLLTFLAFYMQIKANQIQISQFNKGLANEKFNRLQSQRKDYYDKLTLLKVDLSTIITDIESKSKNIKIYFENLRKSPFETQLFYKTPMNNYVHIMKIDRLAIFNGFSTFLGHRENWIKDFSNLYNLLDFLPDFFKDIYEKIEYQSKESYKNKMKIREGLFDLMNKFSKIIDPLEIEKYPSSIIDLVNATIYNYQKLIKFESEEGAAINKETDFGKLNESVFNYFLFNALKIRKIEGVKVKSLDPIIILVSDLRKKLALIKTRALEFSSSLEIQYGNLMTDKENKSYFGKLTEIQMILEEELSNIKFED